MHLPAKYADRRVFLGLLGVGLAVTIAGCGDKSTNDTAHPTFATPSGTGSPPAGNVPPAHPGQSSVLFHGPAGNQNIALTIDDGFNVDVVAGYVAFAQRTGIHLTFSPNGCYAAEWDPHAEALKPLLDAKQVQIMNHTFSHQDMRKLTDAQITDELERNDEWVTKTFGITTRPYYRPPFGAHNPHIDGVAAGLGYTRTVLWNGTYSDSEVITPEFLMSQAQKYLQPGAIMLGHANHPAILGLFDQIYALIKQRNLNPVTLDEMFGTSRASG